MKRWPAYRGAQCAGAFAVFLGNVLRGPRGDIQAALGLRFLYIAVEVGNRTKLCVTRGSRQAAEVLKILRLTNPDPPNPPEGKETVM